MNYLLKKHYYSPRSFVHEIGGLVLGMGKVCQPIPNLMSSFDTSASLQCG